MRFLPLETCKKLVELGCKSESGLYYTYLEGEYVPAFLITQEDAERLIPAFCLEDFCGSTLGADNFLLLLQASNEFGGSRRELGFYQKWLAKSHNWVKEIEEILK